MAYDKMLTGLLVGECADGTCLRPWALGNSPRIAIIASTPIHLRPPEAQKLSPAVKFQAHVCISWALSRYRMKYLSRTLSLTGTFGALTAELSTHQAGERRTDRSYCAPVSLEARQGVSNCDHAKVFWHGCVACLA